MGDPMRDYLEQREKALEARIAKLEAIIAAAIRDLRDPLLDDDERVRDALETLQQAG